MLLCYCNKHHDQKQLREDRIYFTLLHIIKGSQVRRSRQKPGGRNWSRNHGRMLLTGLVPVAFSVCFLLQPRPPCLGTAQFTGPGPPTSVDRWEHVSRTCLQASVLEATLQLRFLPSSQVCVMLTAGSDCDTPPRECGTASGCPGSTGNNYVNFL